MTPLFPASFAAAQPPRTALIIDRKPERLARIRREVARLADFHVLESTADFGQGIVGTLRLKPDCVLLGWDGSSATADIAGMLKRLREQMKLVIVAGGAEELALARGNAASACALLPVDGLAAFLPGLFAGREAKP